MKRYITIKFEYETEPDKRAHSFEALDRIKYAILNSFDGENNKVKNILMLKDSPVQYD